MLVLVEIRLPVRFSLTSNLLGDLFSTRFLVDFLADENVRPGGRNCVRILVDFFYM
jgi:hypothetical protein